MSLARNKDAVIEQSPAKTIHDLPPEIRIRIYGAAICAGDGIKFRLVDTVDGQDTVHQTLQYRPYGTTHDLQKLGNSQPDITQVRKEVKAVKTWHSLCLTDRTTRNDTQPLLYAINHFEFDTMDYSSRIETYNRKYDFPPIAVPLLRDITIIAPTDQMSWFAWEDYAPYAGMELEITTTSPDGQNQRIKHAKSAGPLNPLACDLTSTNATWDHACLMKLALTVRAAGEKRDDEEDHEN